MNEKDKIKKLKALEIIKENVKPIKFIGKWLNHWSIDIGNTRFTFSKEEYDLLKEVLL